MQREGVDHTHTDITSSNLESVYSSMASHWAWEVALNYMGVTQCHLAVYQA